MILFPTVTILMTSIGRMPYFDEALLSVIRQTRQDFELLIINKGSLPIVSTDLPYNFSVHYTGEYESMNNDFCMVSKVFNEAYKAGLIRGKYFSTFYDDDILYPDYIEKMAGYLENNLDANWVACSEKRTVLNSDGSKTSTPPLVVDRIILAEENLDCRLDGMQVMYKTSLLKKVPEPLMNENPNISSCSHSDGIFLNKLRPYYRDLHFISDILCEHRNTELSTYTPASWKKPLVN
jgi:glycosyltransferase involved in cell wall biosynthesis